MASPKQVQMDMACLWVLSKFCSLNIEHAKKIGVVPVLLVYLMCDRL